MENIGDNAPRNTDSILATRYASQEMILIFSEKKKHQTWRKLWVDLAKAEKRLGLPITDEQIQEMEANINNIDYDVVRKEEEVKQHDVMAHISAYGKCCPLAAPIIHLGATSCYVKDNADLIIMREGLKVIESKLFILINLLAEFANNHKDVATLGYTHFQPAQLVTVGKRACLWLQNFIMDFEKIARDYSSIPFLGAKGATGTQASFLSLFENDHKRVVDLDNMLTDMNNFESLFVIAGQTYPRKLDLEILNALDGVCVSANKLATDVRLLSGMNELEEGFGAYQIGSSAMPYKHNPIRSEKICALGRLVNTLIGNFQQTASNQWLERTLDDSANRRIVIRDVFLATDSVIDTSIQVVKGLRVNKAIIAKNVKMHLPFIATETFLMKMVKKAGVSRQECHERLRLLSNEASENMRNGKENNLLELIKNDLYFLPIADEIETIMDPKNFIGRCKEQVDMFLGTLVGKIYIIFQNLDWNKRKE